MRRLSVAFFLVALLLPTVARAQATLAGVVRDSSDAVLPGVTVEASTLKVNFCPTGVKSKLKSVNEYKISLVMVMTLRIRVRSTVIVSYLKSHGFWTRFKERK